jgi:hypothetical protein
MQKYIVPYLLTQDFIVLDFFVGGDRPGGKGVCGRLMSPAHETQSMREIRLYDIRLLICLTPL